MPDPRKIPDERIAEMLDLMVEAKWVHKYAEDLTGFAIVRPGRFIRLLLRFASATREKP